MESSQYDDNAIGIVKSFGSDGKSLLEDVEQPAWTSLSLSESCASWCSNTNISPHHKSHKGHEESEVPLCYASQNFNVLSEVAFLPTSSSWSNESMKREKDSLSGHSTPVPDEHKTPSLSLGSLQSSSGSTGTLHANTKSNSEKFITSIKNMKILQEKFPFRRGSLSRDRGPREDAIGFPKSKLTNEFKLSHSLQDVSSISIASNALQNHKKSVNNESLSLFKSKNKSRDSGFIHSDSLLSLNSNGRNYGHVESKVKLYIQSIKNAEALRRKQRESVRRWTSDADLKHCSVEDTYSSSENLDLESVVEKLKHELAEKDELLHHLQERYGSLLQKYAEAETKIDRLRFGSIGQLSVQQSKQKAKANCMKLPLLFHEQQCLPGADSDISDCTSSDFKLLKMASSINSPSENGVDCYDCPTPISDVNHVGSRNSDGCSVNHKNGKIKKNDILISAPLRPISRLYSTSARLDRILSPLPDGESRSTASNIASDINQKIKLRRKDTTACGLPNSESRSSASYFASDAKQKIKSRRKETITFKGTTISTGYLYEGRKEAFQAVDLLPKEDSFLKVQRWQNYNGQYLDENSNRDNQKYSSFKKCGSLSASENEANGSSGIRDSNNKSQLKLAESSVNLSSCVCQFCEGKCNHCGNTISVKRVSNQSTEATSNNSMESSLMPQISSVPILSEEILSLQNPKLKCDNSSITLEKEWRNFNSKHGLEQDHVVPHSPQIESSLDLCIQNLKESFCSHGKASDWRKFVTLLDFVRKSSCKHCCQFTVADKSSDGNQIGFMSQDSSLLQCLDEVDEYANQLWAKTKSCLDVLDSSN